MSATADRAIRRDIRRAVGSEALGIIDRQGASIQELELRDATQLRISVAHGNRLEALEKRVALLEAEVAETGTRLAAVTATLDAHRSLPLVGRLRWLLTGR